MSVEAYAVVTGGAITAHEKAPRRNELRILILCGDLDRRGSGRSRGRQVRRSWIASLWHRNHERWLTAYHSEIKAR
jgi:hypothetical protein